MEATTLQWGYIGIMEKKMETIYYIALGFYWDEILLAEAMTALVSLSQEEKAAKQDREFGSWNGGQDD